jgi:hypothetical protein
MLGCQPDPPAKEIAPDQLVVDEPIQLTRGPIEKSKKCRLDSINGKVRSEQNDWQIKHGDHVIFGGWAFSDDGASAPAEVFLRLTGGAQTYFAVTTRRLSRNDVTDFFHISRSLFVGFELPSATDSIEPGAYEIMILQVNGSRIEGCDTKTMLLVD